ncbi:hypothetical protein LZ32DRAFT_691063 [Colletotrichum eremochloae]|nr:hypothetical protein LZ32DRAFT_691063 [Colletotrichum eremochloae]
MRCSSALSSLALAATASGLVLPRTCLFPEPEYQICYDSEGATPQNLDTREVAYVAKYLRAYQDQSVKQGRSPFWKMSFPEADNCAEWQVTTKGGTWVMAKLVGDGAAAVTFYDIANTIHGGATPNDAEKKKSLVNCGTAGGQMGVIINGTDPLYQSKEFVDGGFTNKGIVIKLVHNPN